jgi:hypothetical protein
MKRFYFFIVLLISFCSTVYAQKTLGVGVTTPNQKAALHVESPTNNQGFIMPRLSTTQRTAMSLSATEIGLMVYDTDVKSLYIWDGTQWLSSAALIDQSVAFTNSNAASTNTVVSINNPSLGIGLDLAMSNTGSTANGLNINQNGNGYAVYSKSTGTNENAYFEVSNAASSGTPVVAVTNGIGLAGAFQVNNKTTGGSALQGWTNSDVGGALAPVGVYGLSTGAGSLGGAFRINNPGNTFPALYSETNGQGNAATFKNINAFNGAPGVYAETNGTGSAIQANQMNNGVAISILNGGLQYSVTDVSSSGTIPTRSAVYNITAAGTFSIGWTPNSGDVIYVFNNTASSITFEGLTVNPTVLAQLIYIGGAWRVN